LKPNETTHELKASFFYRYLADRHWDSATILSEYWRRWS